MIVLAAAEVQQHLDEGLGIAGDQRELVIDAHPQLDGLGQIGAQKLLGLPDHAVEVDLRRALAARPLRAGVVEEARDDVVQPVCLLDDDLEELHVVRGHGRLVAGGDQQLGRALDRAERVSDLVREARRHLAERGQAVAFLHALVRLARLDHARGGDRELAECLDVLGVERHLGAVVVHDEQAEEPRAELGLGAAEQREHDPGVQIVDARAEREELCAPRLGVGGGRELVDLALELVAVELAAASSIEQRALRVRVDAIERELAEIRRPVEAGTIGVQQVHRGIGHATGLLEGLHDPLDHVGDVDHAGELAAECLEPAAQLGALADQPPVHVVLEPVTHRLEQDEDHEGGDDRIQQEQALLPPPNR